MTEPFTRQRLDYLKTEAGANCRDGDPVEWSLTVAEAHALIAMAERLLQVEPVVDAVLATEAQLSACPLRGCAWDEYPRRHRHDCPLVTSGLSPEFTKEGDRR